MTSEQDVRDKAKSIIHQIFGQAEAEGVDLNTTEGRQRIQELMAEYGPAEEE